MHFRCPCPYSPYVVDISQLTLDQLKELVTGLVDDRLRDLIGDPDLGLELGQSLRARLKASLASTQRVSGEDLATQLGLRW
ncbi:MAG TPA: hypothetical protein VH681_00150 [Nitrospiraceae bacterium]